VVVVVVAVALWDKQVVLVVAVLEVLEEIQGLLLAVLAIHHLHLHRKEIMVGLDGQGQTYRI
jgi:hypothetical protein